MLPFLLVSLATFNVRGLSNELKQSYLDRDCTEYNFDIIAIQETKIKESFEQVFPCSGNKLYVFDQTSCRQRGIGFMINKRMIPCITAIKQVSDNIAYIEVELKSKNGKSTKCRIINAYGPTSPTSASNPQLRDTFYEQLSSAVYAPSLAIMKFLYWEILTLN